MAIEPTKQGLFSSLSLGRASRSPKPPSETLTHPLLGASSSSLNLAADNAEAGPSSPVNGRHSSWSPKIAASEALSKLPYKARQRHAGGAGSTSSSNSFMVPAPSSTTMTAPTVSPTTTGFPLPPTTSRSTSTSFALPPSMSDASTPPPLGMPSHPNGSSSATTRLQLQSLKAAAQRIGLANGTMGMSMIDAIFEKSQGSKTQVGDGAEWTDVLRVLTGGKAVILLPTTPSSFLPMTWQTLRDHVAIISPPIPSSTGASISRRRKSEPSEIRGETETTSMIVTLSGLIGTLRGSSVTFESAIPSNSPLLLSIRDSAQHSSSLSSLRPTHVAAPTTSPSFPRYALSVDSTLLPFPPIGNPGTVAIPVDVREKEKDNAATGRLGRIIPFASFFGSASPSLASSSKAPTPTKPSSPTIIGETDLNLDTPTTSSTLPPQPSSLQPTLLAGYHMTEARPLYADATAENFHVTAFTVSRPVRYAEVYKALAKAIRSFVRDELLKLPDKITERIVKLAMAGTCPVLGGEVLKSTSGDGDGGVIFDFGDPSATGERLQGLIEGVYDELVTHHRADSSHIFAETSISRRKASGSVAWSKNLASEEDGDTERKERRETMRKEREEMAEREACEGSEKVEGLLCRILYNRLFAPLDSDDSRHDEALASRIAALNMLDLSLDHLGLITRTDNDQVGEKGDIGIGLAHIVQQIGEEMQKLSDPSCLTPKDKADVLINAHKIVVDGLSRLPPIQLRPEGDTYKPRSPSLPPQPSTDPETPTPSGLRIPVGHESLDANEIASPVGPTRSRSPSGVSGSTSLSISPAESDPLNSIAQVQLKSPSFPQGTSEGAGSQSDLPGRTSPTVIEEAITDSVMTVTEPVTLKEVETIEPVKAVPSGADLILPIIIFAVVKSNPPQLASHLMFLRRYRSAICLTGEASYAIVNLTAVVEFLEHVDLAELGLGSDSDKVISVADLSPIGLNYMDESNADAVSIASASSRLRGRVFQVGELAGSAADSANKVITGVVDSSWTALRGLINAQGALSDVTDVEGPCPPDASHPEFRTRQASTFSLASVTASVASIAAAAAASTTAARNRSRADSHASPLVVEQQWGGNQEMIEVASRPDSVREQVADDAVLSHMSDEESTIGRDDPQQHMSDARSIRSVSSMLSREVRDETKERMSLSNRLATIGVVRRSSNGELPGQNTLSDSTTSKIGIPTNFAIGIPTSASPSRGRERRGSLLSGHSELATHRPKLEANPSSSGSFASFAFPPELVDPPIDRFMKCEAGDIRLSEVGALLRDYRRLGAIVAALNARQPAHT